MKPQSRRRFLRSGTLAALGAGCALSTPRLTFGASPGAAMPLSFYTQETFEPYLGGIFRGRGQRRAVNLELTHIAGHPAPKHAHRRVRRGGPDSRSFCLTFHADGQLSDATTIHTLQHGALGRLDIFLSRRGEAEGGRLIYEAVFNHLT